MDSGMRHSFVSMNDTIFMTNPFATTVAVHKGSIITIIIVITKYPRAQSLHLPWKSGC